MLRDGERLIKPIDVKEQIPWDKAEAVVVLVQMPKGQENKLLMSSVTWNEVAMLSAQLDAHLKGALGLMDQSF